MTTFSCIEIRIFYTRQNHENQYRTLALVGSAREIYLARHKRKMNARPEFIEGCGTTKLTFRKMP